MEVLLDTPEVKTCRFGAVVCSHYRTAVNVAAMDREFAFQLGTAERFGRVSSLALIDADLVGSPSAAVKVRAAELTRTLGERVTCGAFVVLGSGFPITVMKHLLSAFHFLSGTGDRQRIFFDLDEAVAWLRAQPGQGPEVEPLTAAAVRRAFALDEPGAA